MISFRFFGPLRGFQQGGILLVLALTALACEPGTSIGGNHPVGVDGGSDGGTSAPAILSFSPNTGYVGTSVVITGTNLLGVKSVEFQDGTATDYTVDSASQVTAKVPQSATSGPIAITTFSGNATSSDSFTVLPSSTSSLDLSIAGWYISQAIQKLDRSVPLVANRDGLLRVFVNANQNNSASPIVRVTVTGGAPSPWSADITNSGVSVPTTIDEAKLSSSWNVRIPGVAIKPGSKIKIEIDPNGAIAELDRANNTISADLDVQTVTVYRITLVPITMEGKTGNVDSGRTLQDWMRFFWRVFPMQNMAEGIDVQKAATPLASGQKYASLNWSSVLWELEAKRTAEKASDRTYYGVIHYESGLPLLSATVGMAAGQTAVGFATDYGNFATDPGDSDILAHELGHTMGLMHAPCQCDNGLDPNWPDDSAHVGGAIGAFGIDLLSENVVRSQIHDVMGYCMDKWVSDYTYKKVMTLRSSATSTVSSAVVSTKQSSAISVTAVSTAGATKPKPEECLLVSGQVEHGQITLSPAFQVLAVPSPPTPGDYMLELDNSNGRTFARVPFAPIPLSEGDSSIFVFTVPMSSHDSEALARMSVVADGKILDSRQTKRVDAPLPSPNESLVADPTALKLTLNWDYGNYPKVMVRDPRTNEIIAFGEGGSIDLATDAAELEVTFSDGVRSQRKRLKAVGW